ncbi:MAG: hypothetical protein HND52_18770 [Ignavibacteriae bacterium]|nr:hypothetical protein [Ignavibacteriota bacterium]NOH00009.1 hypothetical protein [Ignavibacteriota bacterium]
MFGSEILEIAIGLIFIYMLLSLFASTINEIIAKLFSLRGRNLRKAIHFMFDEEDTQFQIQRFFNDPLIKKLSARPILDKLGIKSPTDYLPKNTFSKILTKAIFKSNEDNIPIETLEKHIDEMFPQKGDSNRILKRLVRDSAGNIEKLKNNLENWYDDIMDVATEWYKSKVRVILFFIGFAFCILFNADTIKIVNSLSVNPEVRKALVSQAEELSKNYVEADTSKTLDELKVEMQNLNMQISDASSLLGLGWSFESGMSFWGKLGFIFQNIPNRIWGWIITSLAISLGASFWFNFLQRVINLKSSVKK